MANHNIDVGLEALCAHSSRGQTLSQIEIASVCGCSRTLINNLEKSAMVKLRKSAKRLNLHDYLVEVA